MSYCIKFFYISFKMNCSLYMFLASGIKNLLFESFVSSHFTVVPEKTIANKFYNFMEQLEAKKQKNLFENQKLTKLRDWLLPMLMNGQVTVN